MRETLSRRQMLTTITGIAAASVLLHRFPGGLRHTAASENVDNVGTGHTIGIKDRYWTYGGQKVLLIGGWNHGHNPFIDHNTIDANGSEGVSTEAQITAAMDEMVGAGGNLLRCVLDPGTAAGIQGFDFCGKAGDLYDLNQMTGPFWTRLDFFLREAQKRKIIVGMEIWDRFDWYDGSREAWPVHPFNPQNNINYTTATSGLATSYPGKGDRTLNPFGTTAPGQPEYETANAQGKRQLDLVRGYQERFIDKLLSVTFAYGNVLYSMNNEVRYQHPAWGAYWIRYIKKAAAAAGKTVFCTDMFWDLLRLPGPCRFDQLMSNPGMYDYFDVSQTSAHPQNNLDPREGGAAHWDKIIYAVRQARRVDRLLHMNKIYGSRHRQGGWMGSDDNAVEEFWRSLIAGVAGVRFHRPESGIGLSEKSKNCMRAARLAERLIPFWEVEPREDLLTDVKQDEAYVAAAPGRRYILFFTDGGSVGLKMDDSSSARFTLTWINVKTGSVAGSQDLEARRTATIAAPSRGHWAATLVRK